MLAVPELVQPALLGQHALPVGAVRCSPRHGAEQRLRDGDDLPHAARAWARNDIKILLVIITSRV